MNAYKIVKTDIITLFDNSQTTKWLPLQPLTSDFSDSKSLFVNHTIGCVFSEKTILKQLHTHSSNVYVLDFDNQGQGNGYFVIISIENPKSFKDAILNNSIHKIYMDVEIELLKEMQKLKQKTCCVDCKDVSNDISQECNLYCCSMLKKEKTPCIDEAEYSVEKCYKSSKPKQTKTTYQKQKSQRQSRKINYMRSNIRQKTEHKKKSISHTKSICNSIKRKEYELSKCNILSQQIFCGECNIHLSEVNAYSYNREYFCVDCYNCYYVYDTDYDVSYDYYDIEIV